MATTAPISANQKAIISKYHLEVFDEKGMWHVRDEAMYKKYALKDASKKGRYQGKTLDEALQQAVAVRKSEEGETTSPAPAATERDTESAKTDSETSDSDKPKSKATRSKDKKKAGKPAAAEATEKKPKPTKGERKKDHRFLRAFRIIAAKPGVTPETIAKEATMSVKMAGGCQLAWNAAMQVLEETKKNKK